MVEIGGRPILWHIMMHYSTYGFKEFVVALGYKGEYIKRYMADYCSLASDLRISLKTGRVEPHGNGDNGEHGCARTGRSISSTPGSRPTPAAASSGLRHISATRTFMLTWGDGVSNVNLTTCLKFHRSHGKLATVTAVRPPARFGHLEIDGDQVARFAEKPPPGEAWINGAFFVLEPQVFDYIDGDATLFEREPLERLARDGQLMAYQHHGFWQCMDTMRDKVHLESLWASGDAPWKIW